MSDTIKASTETVRGRVIIASDADYDDAPAVYNAMHDRRPHAVVQCTDSADVMAVNAAARDSGVDLAIRGGGHSVPGFGTVDDREHSEEAERERRLSQPVLKALRETGLVRMTTPRSLGGLETDPLTRALVGEVIGRHDSAAAWTLENPLDWALFYCRPPSKSAT